MPKIVATLFIVSLPPTGQYKSSSPEALTHASANARHPAKPHPPQLAAGNCSSTSSYPGIFIYLKFPGYKIQKITAGNVPITLSVAIVYRIVILIT
jgi:hypothetical protein